MLQCARWKGRTDEVGHMYADMCDILDHVKIWYNRPIQPENFAEERMRDEQDMKRFLSRLNVGETKFCIDREVVCQHLQNLHNTESWRVDWERSNLRCPVHHDHPAYSKADEESDEETLKKPKKQKKKDPEDEGGDSPDDSDDGDDVEEMQEW